MTNKLALVTKKNPTKLSLNQHVRSAYMSVHMTSYNSSDNLPF